MLGFLLVVVWLGVAGSTLLWGLQYYLLPLKERAFSPLAPVFAPTGTVGHGLGIVGTTLLLVGVLSYSLRKRVGLLGRLGQLRHWLQVHIFLCTLGPFLVLLHTSFKFGGLVSVAFWSMALVVASGVFGRYVYVRIPKTLNGRFLDLEAIAGRTAELGDALRERAEASGERLDELLEEPDLGEPKRLAGALAAAVRGDLRGRLRRLRLGRLLRREGVPRGLRGELLGLVRERDRLRQQTLLLRPFQRLFRYWHVAHLPLAFVMFVILGIHVAVAILFGYTWLF